MPWSDDMPAAPCRAPTEDVHVSALCLGARSQSARAGRSNGLLPSRAALHTRARAHKRTARS
ncbi:hypothetical protein OAN61_00315 [bacterium]|nr:hypothetical protein [bacterium]